MALFLGRLEQWLELEGDGVPPAAATGLGATEEAPCEPSPELQSSAPCWAPAGAQGSQGPACRPPHLDGLGLHPSCRVIPGCLLLTLRQAWRAQCALRMIDQIQELPPRVPCSAGHCGLGSAGAKACCLGAAPVWGGPWSRGQDVACWCFQPLFPLAPVPAPGPAPFQDRGTRSASFPQPRASEPFCCLPAPLHGRLSPLCL